MLKTLYSKLALALFGVLTVTALVIGGTALYLAPAFMQELNQKLNLDLAANIVKEKQVLKQNQVNEQALQSIFMGLMLVNPGIEVYLVDTAGKILAYSAPPGKVKRDTINLKPVQKFMSHRFEYPVLGDDPRDAARTKVFSAAPIFTDNELEGYLYVVLGGEQFDSIVKVLNSSYIIKVAAVITVTALLLTLGGGLLVFGMITKRLNYLTNSIETFKKSDFKSAVNLTARYDGRPGDEIDMLGMTFKQMSDRIIQQLRELETMDATRRELVANVSHDLRTPLASLQGYLETLTLKGNTLSEQERSHYLDIAFKHSKRLGKLISELFELATLENQKARVNFEPFSLTELAQDITQKFQLEASKKGIKLGIQLPPSAPYVSADIALIERVLENLLENAIKYTPDGGAINLTLAMAGQHITTKIEDTGIGISHEDIPHVFDRFYRVAKSRADAPEGTGLGLAIAKRILQLHDSIIDVQSELHKGTTFTFPLPLANAIH